MSYEHSPHKRRDSSDSSIDLEKEFHHPDQVLDEVFLWDTAGDKSVLQYFESEFLDARYPERDFGIQPFWDINRSLSVTCNRVNRHSLSEISPERRPISVLPEVEGIQAAQEEQLPSRPVSHASLDRQEEIAPPVLQFTPPEILAVETMATELDRINRLTREMRVARNMIDDYNVEDVLALDFHTYHENLTQIKTKVAGICDDIDDLIEMLEDVQTKQIWTENKRQLRDERRTHERAIKAKVLQCLNTQEGAVLLDRPVTAGTPQQNNNDVDNLGEGNGTNTVNGVSLNNSTETQQAERAAREARENAKIHQKRVLVTNAIADVKAKLDEVTNIESLTDDEVRKLWNDLEKWKKEEESLVKRMEDILIESAGFEEDGVNTEASDSLQVLKNTIVDKVDRLQNVSTTRGLYLDCVNKSKDTVEYPKFKGELGENVHDFVKEFH